MCRRGGEKFKLQTRQATRARCQEFARRLDRMRLEIVWEEFGDLEYLRQGSSGLGGCLFLFFFSFFLFFLDFSMFQASRAPICERIRMRFQNDWADCRVCSPSRG